VYVCVCVCMCVCVCECVEKNVHRQTMHCPDVCVCERERAGKKRKERETQ